MKVSAALALYLAYPSSAPGAFNATSSAPAPVPSPDDTQSGVMSEADLVALARSKSAVGDDQFSNDPTLGYVGRAFAVTVPSSDLDVTYNRDTHVLRVSLRHQNSPDLGKDSIELENDVQTTTYPAQNAFGATTTVISEHGNTYGILIPPDPYTRELLAYAANMNGDAARALSENIRLRLFGKVTRDSRQATAVIADLSMSVPSLDHPVERLVTPYLVCATFSKAEWIDTRTRVVLSTRTIEIPVTGAQPQGMVWARAVWLQLADGPNNDKLARQFQRQFQRLTSKNPDLLKNVHGYLLKSSRRTSLVIGPFDSAPDAQAFADKLEPRGIIAMARSNSDTDILVPLGPE